MPTDNQVRKNLFSDRSLWFLLSSNLIVIFLAVAQGWNLSILMWIYWFQSVTIGFFNFIRMLKLKEFSTKGLTINGQPAQPTQSTKIFTAIFFLIHYGLFHFGYLIFLLTDLTRKTFSKGWNSIDFKYILLAALLFFINHLFSYIYNQPRDTKKQNIGSLMFYPYARIIPMHITLIFSSTIGATLPLFLALKTFADCIMHIVEHKIISKGEEY